MSATLSTASRNAACAAVVNQCNQGAGAGKLKIRTSGAALLVSITLADPAFGAPSVGVATAAGLPLSGTASGNGTADNAEVTDSDDTVLWSGTLAALGLTLDNTSIASGQTVTINTWTHTQPAS
jgi:hypothetical protein